MYRSLDGQDYARIEMDVVIGILINCWQTLFQVLVNFYENVMLHVSMLHVAWKFKVV
jgi:hypothetical protein